MSDPKHAPHGLFQEYNKEMFKMILKRLDQLESDIIKLKKDREPSISRPWTKEEQDAFPDKIIITKKEREEDNEIKTKED